jgi:hypothetical protein
MISGRPLVVTLLYCLLAAVTFAGAQTTLGKREPRLMSSYKWASLTERQRDIYVKGFLETVSFILYSHSRKDNQQQAQTYSDWTACAERKPLSAWQTLEWMIEGKLERTVAAQFFDSAAGVCKDFVGKGDMKWRSVWLLKPAEWKTLSLHDRAVYLMAYFETVFLTAQRAKDTANERKLDICVASAGIEGLISSMERTQIEWQFPLPWSVSRVLGATCKD